MNEQTRGKIDRLITQVAEAPPDREWELASKAISTQTTDVVYALASAALVEAARVRRRKGARGVEQGAEIATSAAELPGSGGSPGSAWRRPKRGTRAYVQWVETSDEGREYEASMQEAELHDMEIQARHSSRLSEIIREYEANLRIQWTEELLSTEFALGDGTRVTWGDATVEQHAARAAMFETLANGNLEGAARHRKAISDLQSAGASSLSAMVGVAA